MCVCIYIYIYIYKYIRLEEVHCSPFLLVCPCLGSAGVSHPPLMCCTFTSGVRVSLCAQLCCSTGYVIRPYQQHPTLLPRILAVLRYAHQPP
jgi:hypothetical protein